MHHFITCPSRAHVLPRKHRGCQTLQRLILTLQAYDDCLFKYVCFLSALAEPLEHVKGIFQRLRGHFCCRVRKIAENSLFVTEYYADIL